MLLAASVWGWSREGIDEGQALRPDLIPTIR